MPTKIERYEIPGGRRILAVSDIHGHRALLEELLRRVGYCEGDELFVVGDLIAKGPDSLGTLRLLMALSRNPAVHVLKGNMEAWHLMLLDDRSPEGDRAFLAQIGEQLRHHGRALFQEMLDELGMPPGGVESVPAAKAAIAAGFAEEVAFLRDLPEIVETRRLIFVHGGIPTDDLDSLKDQDGIRFLKSDAYMNQGYRFDKTLILGHWPATLYRENQTCHLPFVNRAQNMIGIDGGCGVKTDGQLNALILREDDPLSADAAYLDGFPVRVAGQDQKASPQYTNIDYRDSEVAILREGPEFSLVEHASSGRRMQVLNEWMWNRRGDRAQCEFTDYALPVSRGDRLSVVRETSEGYLVKKQGRLGWYRGALE